MTCDYYWREDEFVTLIRVAEKTSGDPDLAEFTEFCRLRERGLRGQAMAAMNRFVDQAKHWPLAKRRELVDYLMLSVKCHNRHIVTPQPFSDGLVMPTLKEWMKESPSDSAPRRWLGLLTHNADLLEEAIRLDSGDQIALQALMYHVTYHVDYDLHHLPYAYLGNPAESMAELDRAEELLPGLDDAEILEYYRAEIAALREVVCSYQDYVASNSTESFEGWAVANDRPFFKPCRKSIDKYLIRTGH